MTTADGRKLNKDAGFSLVELLIAVVILAIILIPLLNVFLSSNRINIKSRQTLRATTAAQDIMEGLKAYNIEEVKAQFADPASGFYVIDSKMIKGGVQEETSLEVDGAGNPVSGYYVFSMEDIALQGGRFDAKIEIDGTGYMSGTLTHDHEFNDAALADARSIDKENGTFVETEEIRQAVLKSVFKDSDMETAIKSRLTPADATDTDKSKAYANLQDDANAAYVCYKNASAFFDRVSRTMEVTLSTSADTDEDGNPKVDMEITQTYVFEYTDAGGTKETVSTTGDMGSGIVVNGLPRGSIARMKDAAGKEWVNVNLFYYPLYGFGLSNPDNIIIHNESGAGVNLLIAKQRHETTDATTGMTNLSDPEYYSDPQLMAAEQSYKAQIELTDTHGFDPEKFTLKTNLGSNLVGEKYIKGTPGVADPAAAVKLPQQIGVTAPGVTALNQLNIFTLDGVRNTDLGKAGSGGEATELIYDVEIGIYEEGAAADGFPQDMRMVVIGGSMTN
ncbi:MAG: prepilin-type N-terminal cleavage/methylation domain-containing protein [Bacteroidales bacterium]|nr:prepilin-type N-terminal cleavage/methylation domain-containing protein [Bacteroidales bacterium]MCM1415124.1 prepilin-type N-terminal cleavage/methylation domain-containing protein [bacterium]